MKTVSSSHSLVADLLPDDDSEPHASSGGAGSALAFALIVVGIVALVWQRRRARHHGTQLANTT